MESGWVCAWAAVSSQTQLGQPCALPSRAVLPLMAIYETPKAAMGQQNGKKGWFSVQVALLSIPEQNDHQNKGCPSSSELSQGVGLSMTL